MGRPLTLREALASDRLAEFVRQAEARGIELASGSELERALALLITQRRSGTCSQHPIKVDETALCERARS
jgi:hypothetical protein